MKYPRFLGSVYFYLKIVALVYKSAYSLFSRVCTKNPTYKEPKPDLTLIKEREKYEAEEREYDAKAEIASQEYEKRLREEDPALAAFQDEFARQGDIMIAKYDRYIQAKMDAGFSREDAVRLWKHDQNK